MNPDESRQRAAWLQSKPAKFILGILMIASGVLAFVGTASFIHWLNPDPETASMGRRLAADILFLPMLFILFFAGIFGSMGLMIGISRMFNLGAAPPEESNRPSYTELRRSKARRPPHGWEGEGSARPETPDAPPQWPYWFLALLFGSLFIAGVYFVLQDMEIRHIPSEDWVTLGFVAVIAGGPAAFALFRIRQIHRGEPIHVPGPARDVALPPVMGKVLMGLLFGLFLLFLAGMGYLSAQRTLEFEKTAKPAQGTVTRWVYHPGVRSGHYNVEVRYQTPDGRVRTVECSSPSLADFLMPNVGATVSLLYNPYNPMEVRIADFTQMWSGTLLCLFLFILLSAVTGFALARRWRRSPLKRGPEG